MSYNINDKRRYVLRTKNYKEALKVLRADLQKMRATGAKIHSRIGKLRPVYFMIFHGREQTLIYLRLVLLNMWAFVERPRESLGLPIARLGGRESMGGDSSVKSRLLFRPTLSQSLRVTQSDTS